MPKSSQIFRLIGYYAYLLFGFLATIFYFAAETIILQSVHSSMREDRLKPSEFFRTKTNSPSHFRPSMSRQNGSSRTSMLQQLQMQSKNDSSSISAKIDKQSFNNKYQRALKLMNQNSDPSSKNALSILNHLCAEIQKLPDDHQIPNDLLEKVVINCWRLKNKFKETQIEYRKQCLHFIRHYVSFLDQNYKRKQIHKHGLQMLYLIQANEEYEQKLYKESLQSCEQSLKNCRGTKNQPHFLKVHYLKSKIYAVQKNFELQLAEIKKCIIYLNNLSAANLTDGNEKQYLQKLKQVVEDRKQTILELGSDKKQILDFNKQASAPKFRRRSISLKKITSDKNLAVKVPIPISPRATPAKTKTIHMKSISNTKHQSSNEMRKEFFPVDINKKSDNKTKLKKKPLKIQESMDSVMDDIEYTPLNFNHEDLMLPRPRQKKLESEIATEGPATNQRQELDIQRSSSNKQLNESQQSFIEPVTHLNNINTQQKEQSPEYQQEMLVRECVRQSEQNLFRLFAKIHFKKEPVHETITLEDNSLQGQQILLNLKSELVLKHQQTSCHEQFYFEQKIFTNSDVKVDDYTQLCTYYGVLSDFWFSIKIERMDHSNANGQIYKILHMDFRAVLDKIWHINATLPYSFYNSYERNLQFILDQIIQRENSDCSSALQNIKEKLFSLISNRLILVKKANGIALVPKTPIHLNKNHLASAYKEELRNRLIIFELNNLTKDYHKYRVNSTVVIQKKNKEEVSLKHISSNASQQSNGQMSDCQDIDALHFYLPKLMEILSEDLRSQNPSLSSMKRFKTQKFQKDNILGYTTNLIKINEQSDVNTRLIYQDAKSENLVVMPSDFHTKINNFFEHCQDNAETSIPQFYYCMKFLLIKPPNLRLNDTLCNFYDRLSVKYLHKLKGNQSVSLEMSCYTIKDIFKHKQSEIFKDKQSEIFKNKQCEIFFKFQVLFQGEKIKMMKFIATSQDISKIQNNSQLLENSKQAEKSLKNSRKNSQRAIIKQPLQNMVATQSSMLNLLKQMAPKIFVKKDYIYSVIGFETKDPSFCRINKFRLEGKTTQNKQFMIPHLKYIHILLQKSIKMHCENLKEYAVVTVRQITKSIEFNLIFYLPKLQKTYSVNLQRDVIKYLSPSQLAAIFQGQQPTKQHMEEHLFMTFDDPAKKKYQGQIWNRLVGLFKFETKHYDDNTIILLQVGSYTAFLKDSSFSEYFELKKKIFHLEMSVSKKSGLLSPAPNTKNKILSSSKRKSSSSKEIINNVNQSLNGFIKRSVGRVFKKSKDKRPSQPIAFRKPEVFQRLNQVYESDANKYILYLSLTQVHQIKNSQSESMMRENKKINYSFYLSDLIALLKDTKKQLSNQEQKINNEFNEEKFSFAILLRAMTIIKYRIIEQLKGVQVQSLFEGSKRIVNQKIFKNKLNSVLNSQTDSAYSLNACKRLHAHQKNVYLIHRNIMNVGKGIMVSIFYEQKSEKITFVITSNHELTNKQRCYDIRSMHFPCIEMYKKEQLFKVNSRIYSYYQNVLRFL